MSKSYGNAIYLTDSHETMSKKVKMMITDPQRVKLKDPGHPEVCNVFTFHNIYQKDNIENIESRCRNAEIGCIQCKQELADIIYGFTERFSGQKKRAGKGQ
ncbi:MAG: hypothetical protein U5N58_09470 [Actinomycetota bacterium]|nr:hypothetical protein [Actinomycetota bacterium]